MDKVRIAYISSTGHSGSTLLDILLGSQPGFESTGELVLLPLEYALDRKCTCGDVISKCALWSPVLNGYVSGVGQTSEQKFKSLDLGWMPADVQYEGLIDDTYRLRRKVSHAIRYIELKLGLSRSLFAGRRYVEGLRVTFDFYDRVAKINSPNVIINSSKSYLHAVDQYLASPERVKIINLVRDGRAVFCSFMRHGFNREFSIDAWRNHYERALSLFEKWVPEGDRINVRYEDLARNPAAEIKRLTQFMGQEFNEASVSLDAKVHHNVNGNDARFGTNRLIRLDERWRRDLTVEDLAFFYARAGDLNRRLGYSD
ncbi:sulfotransferase family protein [Ideonella dechloratans]|uniref:sulfotransferase family protein n=1 Tax=Ideonella dechloratans TaxID=36863 RepID=UPI0035AE805E